MIVRQKLYLVAGLLIVWFLATTVLRNNLGGHVRYFSDEADRIAYFERGVWFPKGQIPYRDVFSEYPQVPTFLFGVFYIPILGEKDTMTAYMKFTSLFSLAMLWLLFMTINQVYKLMDGKRYLSFLLLLPAPLYFTINRFDILPAYLCLLSFSLVHSKKWDLAAIVLAIAAMTKWYPVLLLPTFLVYCYWSEHRINWRMAILFSLTCFLIVLPTLLLGGMDALLVPYRFQGIRGLETVSLPAIMRRLADALTQKTIPQNYFIFGFLFMQTIAAFISFFTRINNVEKLLHWCILIITMFVLFARIYSPQWLLWILPFLILTSKKTLDTTIIVFYSIITYIGFPVVYDLFGETSHQMTLMGLINIAFLILIASRTALQIRSFDKPKAV